MHGKNLKLLIAATFAAFAGTTVLAAPVDVLNDRPAPIGVPASGPTLQSDLNSIFGVDVVNANTDQSNAAMWHTTTLPPFASTIPVLAFESLCAGSDCSSNAFQEFGFFTQHDTLGPITRVAIFNGSASPITNASVAWSDNTTLTITGGPGVNAGTFTGIEAGFFGFYYKFTADDSPYQYSVDSLNSVLGQTQAAMLAYKAAPGSDTWALAFDYNAWQPAGSGGLDYNDMVVKIESVTAVPEPETYAMLIAGLGLMGFIARRRRNAA